MADPAAHPAATMAASNIDVFGGYGPELTAIGWTFASVTAVLMIMRIVTVSFVSKSRDGYWPLFWALVGFTLALSEQVISTRAVQDGLGNHLLVLAKAGKVDDFLYWTYLSVFFFLMNIGMGKIVGCSFLLALHTDTHPKRRYLLHFVWASNALFGVPAIFLLWFRCDPPSAMFKAAEQGQCDATTLVRYAEFLLAWSALSDLVMSLMPTFLVWPLQMRLRLKLVVCFLMGLGVLAAAGSIMVAVYAHRLLSKDASYDAAILIMWGKATCWLVLISASVPPIWPLFKFMADRARGIRASRLASGSGTRSRSRTAAASKRASFIRLEEGTNRSAEWPLSPSPEGKDGDMHIVRSVQVSTTLERSGEADGEGQQGWQELQGEWERGHGRAYSKGMDGRM